MVYLVSKRDCKRYAESLSSFQRNYEPVDEQERLCVDFVGLCSEQGGLKSGRMIRSPDRVVSIVTRLWAG